MDKIAHKDPTCHEPFSSSYSSEKGKTYQESFYPRKENKNLTNNFSEDLPNSPPPTTIHGQEVQISKWIILLADLGGHIPFSLKVEDPNGEDAVTRS